MKERLDVLVVSRGLAPSREKAKAIIMAGNVHWTRFFLPHLPSVLPDIDNIGEDV